MSRTTLLWKAHIKNGGALFCSILSLGVSFISVFAEHANAQQRPPAVPLVTHNPYFSVWSMADRLTDQNTKHWTGTEQPLSGLIRIDGATYRYMGRRPGKAIPAMQQVSLSVRPTHTIYTFEGAGVRLTVTFFTPAFPEDLDLLSRPVTYLTWDVTALDSKRHDVAMYLDADPVLAVNTDDQQVIWSRARAGALTVLSEGSRDQRVLGSSGDNLRIDWGYFRMAVPDSEHAFLANAANGMASFIASGMLPSADDLEMPAPSRNGAAHSAVVFPVPVEGSRPASRHVLLSYTEGYSIEYLNRKLRPYWQRNGKTPQDMLNDAEAQYAALEQRGREFDSQLMEDLERVGGKPYAQLASLAYRQTLAAHGFAADFDGTPMLFPKENFSNGCISTVDVLYPSAPFFLFFNPSLLEAQLKPVLEYAALPRWKHENWIEAMQYLNMDPLQDQKKEALRKLGDAA
jgi:hypothetical protein